MAAGDEILVRSGKPPDAAAILELWATAYAKPPAPERERLIRLLSQRDTPVFVAEHAGRVVGSVICTVDGWRGNMYRLAVAPDQQHAGIACKLVEQGELRPRPAYVA